MIQAFDSLPNAKLSDNFYLIVAKNLKYGLALNDLVKVIFDKNPTDIESIYSEKVDIYARLLYVLNKSCFEEKDGVIRFLNDTIRHIPSFKKLL